MVILIPRERIANLVTCWEDLEASPIPLPKILEATCEPLEPWTHHLPNNPISNKKTWVMAHLLNFPSRKSHKMTIITAQNIYWEYYCMVPLITKVWTSSLQNPYIFYAKKSRRLHLTPFWERSPHQLYQIVSAISISNNVTKSIRLSFFITVSRA